ncbi:PREDICTED: putative F-box protein At1g64540 [Camelina sativa]|uniref:F-box protein At1g64540 n=1 Tax=Camelina sativa TaxID=90675 RepID=A0ABM0U6M3_CAMSA|nr:PREDICTED: putative F-box protein At1g64540 [Camelina sativa]
MAAKKLETASGNNPINSLPDEVLGQILSLLPTKTAAFTSVLSKWWRNLIPLVQNLDVDDSMFLDPNINSKSFFSFIEETLVLLRDSHIKKFALKCEFPLFDEFLEKCDLYDCLLASSVLEEVNICDDDPLRPLVYPAWVKKIWGSSIQRISICHRFSDRKNHSCFVIKTPNLVYLDFSSYVGKDSVVQFDSLVECRLDLRLWTYLEYVPPEDLVMCKMFNPCHKVLYFCCKSMPEFNNLVKLSFESHKERGWQVLPLLLKKSPNLETLVIRYGHVHEITDECGDACVCVHEEKTKNKNCLLLCRVKVLKIYGYGGTNRELKQMRHFMENLKCLEVVKVKVHQVDEQDKYLPPTSEPMKLLSATSSKCKIQFI